MERENLQKLILEYNTLKKKYTLLKKAYDKKKEIIKIGGGEKNNNEK